MFSDQTRRQKSREVSSRYLSTTVAPPSPNHNQNPTPTSSSSTKQKNKHTGFIRGLWPSSTSKSHDENHPTTNTTLADHLRNDNNNVKRSENTPVLSKQKSSSEFRRHSEKNSNTKKPGKYMFPGRSSVSSSSSSSTKSPDLFDSNQVILPGRLSVDENALRSRRLSYYQMRSDSFSDNLETSDLGSPFRISPVSYMAPTLSSIKSGINVSSKDMNTSSPMHSFSKKSTFKTAKKKASSLTSSSSRSEWDSPSRMGSPSFSSSKPPTSTSKKNLFHIGLDLIKGKKVEPKLGSSCSGMNMENVHQLRLLQNSWMQWKYANARAQDVHENLAEKCEKDLLYASLSIEKLRQSVVHKRLQLQKQKLEMKLNLILHSQTKMLEAWGDIERRHIIDISALKDYLNAVVCMIPLIEGAKMDVESTTIAFQHTSHLVATLKSMLSSVSPIVHETTATLSELAVVATQEKLLLEECFEHLRIISLLEIQEKNLRCSIIEMDSLNEQQQHIPM